jgi:membrane protease YdiL (CAAX protease family)
MCRAPIAPEVIMTAEPAPAPQEIAPRVWTVFAAFFAAVVLAVGSQFVGTVALAVWLLAHGTSPGELRGALEARVTSPPGVIFLLLLAQVGIGLSSLVPARLSPQPALLRLRLVKPALPAWSYPVVAVASLVPLAAGLGLAHALATVLSPGSDLEGVYQQMTLPVAILFVLLVALAPGLTEEVLFRGYIQGRLLERWSPGVAITVTSVLFTLMHVTPHAMAAVIPLAFWLGALAWRTGSVWPGIVCHAFVNGAWNAWQVSRLVAGLPEMPPAPALIGVVLVALVCFAVSCRLLWRARPAEIGGKGHATSTPPA